MIRKLREGSFPALLPNVECMWMVFVTVLSSFLSATALHGPKKLPSSYLVLMRPMARTRTNHQSETLARVSPSCRLSIVSIVSVVSVFPGDTGLPYTDCARCVRRLNEGTGCG